MYEKGMRLDAETLHKIYCSNGVEKRIVDLVVEDALRGFIEADRLLLDELDRLETQQTILEAGCKGRLYGGAVLVAFVEDARSYEKPLNVKGIEKVGSLQVFSRHQISWEDEDVCMDSSKEYFGEPEIFTITPESFQEGYSIKEDANNNNIRVHRSRCFIFGGDMNIESGSFWDKSVLEVCSEIRDKGLISLLDRDAENSRYKSYQKEFNSVAVLPELRNRLKEAVYAVTGIPETKLFNRSPANKSDLRQWYDVVRSYRSDQIKPCLNWLIEMLEVQSRWKSKPNNYAWEFPSLTALSESELVDIQKKYAEIDAIYMDRGAIDPVEVWQARYGRGEFHANIKSKRPELVNIIYNTHVKKC